MVRKVGGVVESFDELRNGDQVKFTYLVEHTTYDFEEGESYLVGFDDCGDFGIIDDDGCAAMEGGATFSCSEIKFDKLADEENKRVELTNKHYVHKDDIPDYETYLRVTKAFNNAGFPFDPFDRSYGSYASLMDPVHVGIGVYEEDNTVICFAGDEIESDMIRIHPDDIDGEDKPIGETPSKMPSEEDGIDYKTLLMSVIFSAETYNGHNQAQIPKLSFEEINHLAKAIEEYLENDPDASSTDCEIRLHTDGSGAIYVNNWWKQGEHPLGHLDKLIVDWEG